MCALIFCFHRHTVLTHIHTHTLMSTCTHTRHLSLPVHYVCIMYIILFVRARAGAYSVTPIRHSTNFQDRCLLGRRNMMRNRRRRPGARPTPLLIKPHVPPTPPLPGPTAYCSGLVLQGKNAFRQFFYYYYHRHHHHHYYYCFSISSYIIILLYIVFLPLCAVYVIRTSPNNAADAVL